MTRFNSIFLTFLILLVPVKVVSAGEIHKAVLNGDIKTVKSLISKDPILVNSLDNFKYTPLDWAATRAYWDIFKILIDSGADVNNIGWDGGTVLHRAAHYDRPDMVKLLIDKGINIHVKNQWGRTALHAAARRCCKDVAALLISKGADPNAATKEGWTPLHVAAKSGHKEMIKLLIAKGASKEIKDKDGKTPLENIFSRPAPIVMDTGKYDDYVGKYSTERGFFMSVWKKDGRLYFTDISYDEIYPIGKDIFYCRHEPWKVSFRRDETGEVVELEVAFLRRSHKLKKVK